jgi:hypothetical protein
MCHGPNYSMDALSIAYGASREGPTPKEGGLQLSCCLTQQTESCDEFAVDQEEFATMKYEKSTELIQR